jgi:hypothetical protein
MAARDKQQEVMVDNHWRNHLPDRYAVLPGETIEFESQVLSQPKGNYVFDFDLVAGGVAWFNSAGATGVRVTIEVL